MPPCEKRSKWLNFLRGCGRCCWSGWSSRWCRLASSSSAAFLTLALAWAFAAFLAFLAWITSFAGFFRYGVTNAFSFLSAAILWPFSEWISDRVGEWQWFCVSVGESEGIWVCFGFGQCIGFWFWISYWLTVCQLIQNSNESVKIIKKKISWKKSFPLTTNEVANKKSTTFDNMLNINNN